jgi:hypothetical protein
VTTERPVCTIVIGWGTIAMAVLMAFAGVMALLASVQLGDLPDMQARGTGIDFLFRHFSVVAGMQICVAVLLLVAGRALLSLRRWAARVIEVVAWLGLLYALVFSVWFIQEFRGAMAHAPKGPDTAFLIMMVAGSTFTLLFWSTPLVITIRSLRKEDVRRVLG